MMRILTRFGCIGVAALLLVSGCSWLPDQVDETRDWSAARLYNEAKISASDGRYEEAIDYYEKLQARFPFGRYAQQAQLDLIYTYYRDEQPDVAIAAADRFIRANPRHPNVDYAYYMKGVVNYNRDNSPLARVLPSDRDKVDTQISQQAYNDFAELIQRFPDSRYAEDARQRMTFLRNNVAQYEVNVAEYYLRRKAYVAAANRARYVLENFQQTPAVEGALAVSAEAYVNMGMTDLAQDSVRVLELNFPQSGRLPRAQALVEGREPPAGEDGGWFGWFN